MNEKKELVPSRVRDAIDNFPLRMGQMISSSKSAYVQHFPNNVVVFNANLCTKTDGKIWYGDIDVTESGHFIQVLANDIGEAVYVLPEMAARFGNENSPKFEEARAVFVPRDAGEYT